MRSSRGSVLLEIVIAGAIAALVIGAIVILQASAKTVFPNGDFVVIGGETLALPPSSPNRLIADSIFAQMRDDDIAAATVVVTRGEIDPSYTGNSGRLVAVANASAYDLSDPTRCKVMLMAAGVPFTPYNGCTIVFLGTNQRIISFVRMSFSDDTTYRTYSVSRAESSSTALLKYKFVEPLTKLQPTPGVGLGTYTQSPTKTFKVRFPDPNSPLVDQLTRLDAMSDATARAAAQASVLRTAQYVFDFSIRR